ncbi:hypothetical protein [Bacillus thuringiensis]|uniref:hypothetical protein n=1 Tax=Bacillus thuringiensis TaxID=1428 RepID=UPI001427E011|nr:hypothetical protein [Bacillus thuringiensis]NIL34979.1 hypothetical protein [Bacillus thuringiensis]
MDNYILEIQIKEFKLKLLMSDGQIFEDLFCDLMSAYDSKFIKVRAYGRQGDEKNDGFIPSKGDYYQCYGPEDISKESTEVYAIKKLKEDFKKLLEKWEERWKIKTFSYVINDKYKGMPPSILTEIAALKNEFENIEFNSVDSKKLEDIFINNLTKLQRRRIVGCSPAEVILEMKQSISMQTITDVNIIGWFNIINKNVEIKISKLKKIKIENWYYKNNPEEIRDKYIYDLLKSFSEQEEMEKEYLVFLKKEYSSMYYLWSKYFANEKDIINRLIKYIRLDEFEMYKITGLVYQTFVDHSISEIVKMFNEIVKINNESFGLNSLNIIKQCFDKINRVVEYNDNQKNQELNKVIKSIMESNDCSTVTIFKESTEDIKLDLDSENYFKTHLLQILNGDILNSKEIVKYLNSIYETITEDGTKLFSPHLKTNHIIFLNEFLNSNDKLKIEELQKRSNIAVYYFKGI